MFTLLSNKPSTPPSYLINLAQMLPLKHKSKQNCMNMKICKSWIFSSFLSATAKVVFITVLIFFHLILHPTVLIYDFHNYIHNFIIILSRVYNEPIQQPAPSWLVSSIGRALHRYRRGQGFKSCTSLNFFRLSFHNCKSCI